MTSQDRNRARRGLPLAAALALLLALAATPMASADTSGTVTVTASVATELTLTLCDTEADFGDGLTAAGAAPHNTADAIGVTDPSPNPAEGRFYSWTPSCQAEGTGSFWTVVSSSPWRLDPCATENAGPGASPTMTLARSLRFDGRRDPLTTYADLDIAPSFELCPRVNAGYVFSGDPGTNENPLHLYLRVDPSTLPGTFSSTVTWALEPD